jgi:sn-glycerol 3-phosphate transport system substrate-binding protein
MRPMKPRREPMGACGALGLRRRDFMAGGLGSAFGVSCNERAAPTGRTLVRLWFTYGGRNREVLESLVARFNVVQREVWVKAIYQGDYYEGLAKLRVAIAGGTAPALSHVVGEVIPYLAEARVLEHLDRFGSVERFALAPALSQAGSWVDGGERPLVALPFNRSTPIAYLNGELFRAAKLEAPRTWAELRQVAARLNTASSAGPKRYGFGCPVDWWFWVALVGQAGGQVVERDGRVSLGDEAGAEALELWQSMVLEDRSMKPPPGRDYNAWEQTNQDFLAGRVAMIWTSTAFLKYLEQTARFPVIAAPLPGFRRRAVPTGGTHWVILKAAPEPEKRAAYRFLEFMMTSDVAERFATQTGYIPVTKTAIRALEQSGRYAAHPNERVALDQLADALPWPWSPRLFRVAREIVQPRLEEAVLANGNARSLLEAARRSAAGV